MYRLHLRMVGVLETKKLRIAGTYGGLFRLPLERPARPSGAPRRENRAAREHGSEEPQDEHEAGAKGAKHGAGAAISNDTPPRVSAPFRFTSVGWGTRSTFSTPVPKVRSKKNSPNTILFHSFYF